MRKFSDMSEFEYSLLWCFGFYFGAFLALLWVYACLGYETNAFSIILTIGWFYSWQVYIMVNNEC